MSGCTSMRAIPCLRITAAWTASQGVAEQYVLRRLGVLALDPEHLVRDPE